MMKYVLAGLLVCGLFAGALAQADTMRWISRYNGVDGWFAFQGPQRAMRLNPADYGLSYPVQVESLKIWWYWGMGSWTDSLITFRIYGDDGAVLLWESESLITPSTYRHHYGLPPGQEVRIDSGRFYIATTHRRVDPYAHPYVNVDDADPVVGSFHGGPGNWALETAGEFCFFAFVREVPTGTQEPKGRWAGSVRRAVPALVAGAIVVPEGEPSALYDAAGNLVRRLAPGRHELSGVAVGVYLAANRHGTVKVVVTGR